MKNKKTYKGISEEKGADGWMNNESGKAQNPAISTENRVTHFRLPNLKISVTSDSKNYYHNYAIISKLISALKPDFLKRIWDF